MSSANEAAAPGTVVAWGYDPEPLTWTNRTLLAVETEGVVDGLGLLVESLGARRGILAVPEEEAALRLRAAEALRGRDRLELGGGSGAVPEPPGQVTVRGLERLLRLAEAAAGRPPVSTFVSCVGEVREPALRRVPLGTPLREVIEGCGGPLVEPFVLLSGGVLTGEIEGDLDRPVDAATRTLLLLPAGHPLAQVRSRSLAQLLAIGRAACCGCGLCAAYCSAAGEGVDPGRIMRQLALGLSEPEQTLRAAPACRECGVCEAVCAASLSIWRLNRVLKRRLPAAGPPAPERERGATGAQPGGGPPRGRRLPSPWFLERLGLAPYARRPPAWGGELAPTRVELELAPGTLLRVKRGEAVRAGEAVAEEGGHGIFTAVGGRVLVAEEERLIIAAEQGGIR